MINELIQRFKIHLEEDGKSNIKYDNEFIKNMDDLTFANKKGKTEIINLLQSNALPIKNIMETFLVTAIINYKK